MSPELSVDTTQALRYRWRAQQLDRDGGGAPADTTVLDLGVQDGAAEAARWALANRGVEAPGDLALTWTVRGAPHAYRRAELPQVQVAVSPFSEADAAKRVFDAAKPLRQAGVPVLQALTEVAGHMRDIVTTPTVKGTVSTTLTGRMGPEFLRWCRPCQATHLYEMPFRLGALHGGLELEAGTSPPVLRRVPGWPADQLGPAPDPAAAPPHLQVVRAYLHLLGPAAPKEVATYLDATAADVKQRWPEDAVEVDLAGRRTWVLADDLLALRDATHPAEEPTLRLLSGVDLFTAAKDRDLLVTDTARRKEVWPVLGRPGTVCLDGAVLGTWRARTTKGALTLTVRLWRQLPARLRPALEQQADRLATFRGLRLAELVTG